MTVRHQKTVKTLLEAMPYIRRFWGTTVVLKYGGAAMTSPHLQEQFAEDVVLLRLVGMSLGGSIALTWGTQRVQTLAAQLAAGTSQFSGNTFEIFRQATAQAVGESFWLFAVSACVIALLPAGWLSSTSRPVS